jgi:hypothetical protein
MTDMESLFNLHPFSAVSEVCVVRTMGSVLLHWRVISTGRSLCSSLLDRTAPVAPDTAFPGNALITTQTVHNWPAFLNKSNNGIICRASMLLAQTRRDLVQVGRGGSAMASIWRCCSGQRFPLDHCINVLYICPSRSIDMGILFPAVTVTRDLPISALPDAACA